MKKQSLIFALLILVTAVSCSTVKVMDSWKGDNIASLKGKKMLIIARTDNKQARIAFEEEFAARLRKKGLNVEESFSSLPELNPDEKPKPGNEDAIKNLIQNNGFDGVLVTVVKDMRKATLVEKDGGFYAGGTVPNYYPMYYGGFYGYYNYPMSYSTYGNYVPSTTVTETQKTYILETVVYNLSEPEGKQLVSVVTSKIEDPSILSLTASDYAKAVLKAIAK